MKIIKYIFYIFLSIIVFYIILFAYISIDNKISMRKHQEVTQKYQEACTELDFEAAREYLNQNRQNYIRSDEERKEEEWKYYEAFDYIYKAEIQYILSEFDDEDCVDRITFLLTEIPIEGEKPRAGLCGYYETDRDGWSSESKSLDAYIIWTEHYNRLCNTILTLSINRNYPQLAKAILLHFVDNVETYKGKSDGSFKIDGVEVDGNHGYIKFTSTDRDAAKKKYDEAVKMGYLK